MESLSTVDALTQLSFAVQEKFEEHVKKLEISSPQARLLGIVEDRTPTMYELAQHLKLNKSSITGLVKRAETKGYITCKPSTQDKRSVIVSITPQGKKLITQARQSFEKDITEFLEPLNKEAQKQLATFITQLLSHDVRSSGITLFPNRTKP